MANKHRGEVNLTLVVDENGKKETFVLRPTFQAMDEFEEISKTNAAFLLQEMTRTKTVGFGVLAKAVWTGLKAGLDRGKAPSLVEVGDWIMKTGQREVVPVIIDYLINSMTSEADLEAARNEEEAAKKSDVVAST